MVLLRREACNSAGWLSGGLGGGGRTRALTACCPPAAALDQRPSLARARSPGTPEAPTQSNDRVRPLSPLLVRDATWLASPGGASGGGPLVAAREGPTILIR